MADTNFSFNQDLIPSPNPTFDTALGADLVALLRRKDVTELYLNPDGCVWYLSYEDGKVLSSIRLDKKKALAIVQLAAGQAGKIVNEDIPDVDTEIPGYGCRFHGNTPPIVSAATFNIRKKASRIFTLTDYVAQGVLNKSYKEYLENAIISRKNILVVGGTGTGKTTFLNALLEAMSRLCPNHRIAAIEDLPELQCPAKDYLPKLTKQDIGRSGIRYDQTRLLAGCLRESPDRIILGEVRDGAAFTMLKAWNTGHPGGVCTVHANSAEQGLSRIKLLAQEDPNAGGDLKELIGSAIDLVVCIVYIEYKDGRKGRRIEDIIEVKGYNSARDRYIIRSLAFRPETNKEDI